MEHHVSWLTQFVNHYPGSSPWRFLTALHIKPTNPDMPIPEHVVMALTVLVVCTVLALLLRTRLSVERPGASQQIAELLLTNPMGFGINDVLEENVGHGWRKVCPNGRIGGDFHFVFEPAGHVSVFARADRRSGSAAGLRHPDLSVFQFAGRPASRPGWVLLKPFRAGGLALSADVSGRNYQHDRAILSLTVRLWANMFASDLIYGIFLGLFRGGRFGLDEVAGAGAILSIFPALAPIAFIVLHVFVSVVQAYVFAILPAVYIGLATADEH